MQAAAEDRTVANGGAGVHHEVPAVLHASPWLGYFFVAAPVTAVCAGLLDGPWAAASAYAVLLLGVAYTWRAMLPPRLPERVRANEHHAAANDGPGNGSHREVASSAPEAAIAWCGYVLVAAPVIGSSFGLADTPVAALVAYALLFLGVAFIGIAMLPLRPMERFLREEDNGAVGNGNQQGVIPRARGVDGTGYFFVAAPVLASSTGCRRPYSPTLCCCSASPLSSSPCLRWPSPTWPDRSRSRANDYLISGRIQR
ncbi:hypothetical protein PVAP13_4NG296800 [Panicum virgatum]|uniref:Uncharacterized protein n=1 Tax=Panicum virgatum TaxID=38727 RepID=A0A8T0TFE6_PANVG|nr:hypothetical protein PVAP13_4NG296800 [Panicum virgatum]